MPTPIRSLLFLSTAALFVTALPGCVTCNSSLEPSLVIEVVDADTGEEVCDATVLIEDGDFSQQVTAIQISGCRYEGPDERGGSYTLTVTHPSYQTATIEVDVDENSCHVETQEPRIELTPS